MIVRKMVALSEIPARSRARAGKFADIVKQALDMSEPALRVELAADDGKYASNNLVYSINKGTYAGLGLEAFSQTEGGTKCVYLKKVVKA